ncbi:glycosyltransferase family 2 protein [Natronosporangium hydrolyticum]|uniref:Glycosyltransferase family 2 protein n=1 Tax=Natronosporangium hydrolyticum TaxID=2811111 RepID=A0A895YLU1_9ACTN|nr:glycosyltransferase family 2 protein [Natronosporangium hydrolyticum]QSB16449.1 glycosyltransferase family 2 protein [Natronosporangium hydrolyticum]
MTTALLVIVIIVLSTFLVTNGIYLLNSILAARKLRDISRELRRSTAPEAFASQLTPGVSILVPTRNEEAAIVDTVQSLLALRYPRFEVIVVEGGSTDSTRQRLIDEFELVPAQRASRDAIPTGPVGPCFLSSRYPDLWLMCKPEAGKADALNAGVNAARYPYFATVDGDAILEPEALLRAMQPVLADPSVIGSGGMVRAVNGSVVEHGRVVTVGFPDTYVSGLQIAEYFRSFLLMRTPLSGADSVLIISGAFGLFRRDLVEQVGGYYTETAADDVEIVIHLYRFARETGRRSRIVFLPDPVCWTEVPDTLSGLLRQRRRWHRGLAEAIWRHRRVVFRPSYGRLGCYAMPYLLLELLGPPVEVLAWVTVIVGALLGVLSLPVFLLFLAVSISLSISGSLAALTLAEADYRRHAPGPETSRLVTYALSETFGYRQLVSVACLAGLIDFVRGRRYYTQPTRRGHTRR